MMVDRYRFSHWSTAGSDSFPGVALYHLGSKAWLTARTLSRATQGA